MRWNEGVEPKWVEWVWLSMMPITMPIAAGLLVVLAIPFAVTWLKRTLIGPGTNWTRWYAWRPVKCWVAFRTSEWVWLEWVERCAPTWREGIYYKTPDYVIDDPALPPPRGE